VRQEFDETKRCALLNEAGAIAVDDAPMIYLWTHALVSGVRKGIVYPANASGEVWLPNIRM
jgi:ABC-type transport system substrate-binding protein